MQILVDAASHDASRKPLLLLQLRSAFSSHLSLALLRHLSFGVSLRSCTTQAATRKTSTNNPIGIIFIFDSLCFIRHFPDGAVNTAPQAPQSVDTTCLELKSIFKLMHYPLPFPLAEAAALLVKSLAAPPGVGALFRRGPGLWEMVLRETVKQGAGNLPPAE